MEIKTEAFKPFRLSEKWDKVFVTHELILKGNELVNFLPLPSDFDNHGFSDIIRQEYSYRLLDKYHDTFNDSKNYIEIILNDINKSVYIPNSFRNRLKLKWMNKETFIQKDSNIKWVAGTILAVIGLSLTILLNWQKIKSALTGLQN